MDDFITNPLFQKAPIALSLLDQNFRQVAKNERFTQLFGYEAATTLTSADLTFPDDAEMTHQFLDGIASKSQPGSIEKRYVRADGSMFWGRLSAHVVEIEGSEFIMGAIEDVQQQHDLLAHLALSMQDANEQANLRIKFVSQVSHELRNPLHLIAGTSELLSRSSIPMKERQQAASILQEAISLTSLVDDLLDIGRGEAGQLVLSEGTFSTRSLVHRVHQTVLDQAKAKGLKVTVDVHEAVPVHVTGDEGRLRQILVNLASNAVKFTPRGAVDLSVTADDNGTICFRVSDTGPGVPIEGIETIFQPFVRLSRAESGAGLGLAISNRLADLMGGSLTVENLEPVGAAFELRVALNEAKVEDVARTVRQEVAVAQERRHVLIVEDSLENQLLATAQLESLGYATSLAGDGIEALALIRQTSFDAVLMDWHLPRLNGLETTKQIRQDEQSAGSRRLPIIALTARTMAADINLCFDAGVDDHVSKPAGLDKLRSVLLRWTNPPAEAPRTSVRQLNDALIDKDALVDLFDNLGQVDLVASIVTTYLDQLDERVERILRADDAATVEAAAHVLASTSAIVGAVNLGRVARAIEDIVRSGASPDQDILGELATCAEGTAITLQAEFEQLKVGT